MEEHKTVNILVIWRGKKLNVEINSGATLKEFGHKLQLLTNVKPDTMRLLMPRSFDNSSKLLTPFSDDHSSLSLRESSVLEGKFIRMMGVFEDEIKEVSQNGTKADLRIAGFDEEERRLRQRMLNGPKNPLKLPQGAYIFCDFKTLQLPGIVLNPPASEALKRMHKLAADPGIVAIMNKHRWRVGVMTEMAPVGYVGISPKCILGYNKNHGEEISLRLRTDDLKGFRKYESIKATLLHELAHMVYSEHDADFYSLDKQLNQEAASLDWTRSRSHTLSGHRHSDHYEDEFYEEISGSNSRKLGGMAIDGMATVRATSVAAAYRRLSVASSDITESHEVDVEPDPDDSGCKLYAEPDPDDSIIQSQLPMEIDKSSDCNPDRGGDIQIKLRDHKDPGCGESMEMKPCSGFHETYSFRGFSPDGCEKGICMPHSTMNGMFGFPRTHDEPDPDDFEASKRMSVNGLDEPDPDDFLESEILDHNTQQWKFSMELHADDAKKKGSIPGCRNPAEPDPDDLHEASNEGNKHQQEPDPDDSVLKKVPVECRVSVEPDPDDALHKIVMRHIAFPAIESGEDSIKTNNQQKELESDDSRMEDDTWACGDNVEPDPDDLIGNGTLQPEHNADESNEGTVDTLRSFNSPCEAPDPNEQELQRIQDPVSLMCSRLQKTIETLKSEVSPMEATSVLQTLFKIIQNVIEHPHEMKFRRLRKGNPQFQRNVAKYKAAMEVLFLVGFNEDSVRDEIGRSETYVVLKRNDPGLLWLAKSSLEMCIAY